MARQDFPLLEEYALDVATNVLFVTNFTFVETPQSGGCQRVVVFQSSSVYYTANIGSLDFITLSEAEELEKIHEEFEGTTIFSWWTVVV